MLVWVLQEKQDKMCKRYIEKPLVRLKVRMEKMQMEQQLGYLQ